MLTHLPPFDDDGRLHVVIETPKGSRNKYDWSEPLGCFTLAGVLPAGAVFPFDFGYVTGTRGGDGDPLDVLVLMDEPAFTGCHLLARAVGVIVAEQVERDGKRQRNDRVIAVADESRAHSAVRTLTDLGPGVVDEIVHFFEGYNAMKGKRFIAKGRHGAARAAATVRRARLPE